MEVMTYLINVPIYQSRSEEIGDSVIDKVVSKYCIPGYIIMDEESAFTSSLINYLFGKFYIKSRTVAPNNYQSLQAEHDIKSLSIILTRHLTGVGQMWPKYLTLAMFASNTFNSLNLTNYSPYELVFW